MKPLAIILNVFFPGVGTIIAGKAGMGIAQLLRWLVGLMFWLTFIGIIIGAPLMLAAWIWGLVSVASMSDTPQVVHVVHQNQTNPVSEKPALPEDGPNASAV